MLENIIRKNLTESQQVRDSLGYFISVRAITFPRPNLPVCVFDQANYYSIKEAQKKYLMLDHSQKEETDQQLQQNVQLSKKIFKKLFLNFLKIFTCCSNNLAVSSSITPSFIVFTIFKSSALGQNICCCAA